MNARQTAGANSTLLRNRQACLGRRSQVLVMRGHYCWSRLDLRIIRGPAHGATTGPGCSSLRNTSLKWMPTTVALPYSVLRSAASYATPKPLQP